MLPIIASALLVLSQAEATPASQSVEILDGLINWTKSIKTYDIAYVVNQVYYPAAREARPGWYLNIDSPLSMQGDYRLVSDGSRRRLAFRGDGLHPPSGTHTPASVDVFLAPDSWAIRSGSRKIEYNPTYRGRSRGLSNTPQLLIGWYDLTSNLREAASADPQPGWKAKVTRLDDSLQVQLSSASGVRIDYRLRATADHLPLEWVRFDETGVVRERFVGAEYARIGNVIYPVAGRRESYTSKGELWHEKSFRIKQTEAQINMPPDSIKSEAFDLGVSAFRSDAAKPNSKSDAGQILPFLDPYNEGFDSSVEITLRLAESHSPPAPAVTKATTPVYRSESLSSRFPLAIAGALAALTTAVVVKGHRRRGTRSC